MSEQLELFIGHPPGDEPGKTKIADATASSSWNVNFNNGNVNNNHRNNNGFALACRRAGQYLAFLIP